MFYITKVCHLIHTTNPETVDLYAMFLAKMH